MSKKLYKITLRGMTYGNPAYGISYVVANDSAKAYEKVAARLEERNIGFSSDRALLTVELLAEAVDYPDCGYILYV